MYAHAFIASHFFNNDKKCEVFLDKSRFDLFLTKSAKEVYYVLYMYSIMYTI
jgi:hypothetical protein